MNKTCPDCSTFGTHTVNRLNAMDHMRAHFLNSYLLVNPLDAPECIPAGSTTTDKYGIKQIIYTRVR